MITDVTKDCPVSEQDFEVGRTYAYFIRNKSDKLGQFVLSDFISAYGGVQSVCKPDGNQPEAIEVPETEWAHGIMGDIEKARYIVEEGYYLIQVHTPDGFDTLLNPNQQVDPLIVVSRIEKLEELGVFDSMNMQVRVLHKFNASNLAFLEHLTSPVMEAIARVS